MITREECGEAEAGDLPPPYSREELVADVGDTKYPPPSFNDEATRMNFPVAIPQRRPGSRTRAFMRACALVLAGHDIDEEEFLSFLKRFHKASQVCHSWPQSTSVERNPNSRQELNIACATGVAYTYRHHNWLWETSLNLFPWQQQSASRS